MKQSALKTVLKIMIIAFVAATLSLTAMTVSWFIGPNIVTQGDKYLDGTVGLRNYFFDGDGSEENPFEIVLPQHYYNLTRLQHLGIFPTKKYFRVGHLFDVEGEDEPQLGCIDHYDESGNPVLVDYLDMGTFCSQNTVMAIGSEGVPFVGSFDGQGIPIKNLEVSGYPEDIGAFGYVGPEGSLNNIVFDGLQITSLGYSKTESRPDHILFSQDIDDIFASSSYLVTDTSFSFFNYNSTTDDYDEAVLKSYNGLSGKEYIDINASGKLIGESTIYNGYFKATFPSVTDDIFTYSVSTSSLSVRPDAGITLSGKGDKDLIMDLASLRDSPGFNSADTSAQRAVKIYLHASVNVDGYIFDRVIQSYTCVFRSNAHVYADGKYSLNLYCDYLMQDRQQDYSTNYHHGNNIGLVAGHVDGAVNHCYVHDGSFVFNDAQYHPINAETDTALIGEVGENVSNALDPELGLMVNGDIGVMNFSKIYSMIRTDMVGGASIMAGQTNPYGDTGNKNYVSYKNYINTESISKYVDYLRYFDGKKDENEFLAYTDTDTSKNASDIVWHSYTVPSSVPTDFNSVDFLWNRVIEDEADVDRGLGVFKVVSSYNLAAKEEEDSGRYGPYMVNNIGECRIVNGTPKSKVYFSTAEYDHTKENHGASFSPQRATTLPSYAEPVSFEYPFSREFNYLFELNLADMAKANGNDYMYNTDSPFLVNYLKSKLINKYGGSVEWRDPRFGFMFRSSENELLTSLSSYMPVKHPAAKNYYGTDADGNPRYYPSKSIVFHIDNTNGANVSVVGNGGDISIYSYDPKVEDDDVTKMYTMKSSNTNVLDSYRYFPYDVETGVTATEVPAVGGKMRNDGALYGHIFKLPKGDYVLGCADTNGTSNIYFLAVQGQTDGTLGQTETKETERAIENVDFLLETPSLSGFPLGFSRASFSFSGTFNTTMGIFDMAVITQNDKRYMNLVFATSPKFVTYIMTYSRAGEPRCYINGVVHDGVSYTYSP